METVGRIALLLIGAGMATAYPLSEIARGMATNPSQHPRNQAAGICTLLGLAGVATAVLA